MSTPKQNYSVRISAFQTVVVMAADSEDQASQLAQDEISGGNWNTECDGVSVIPDGELNSARTHADTIVEDE